MGIELGQDRRLLLLSCLYLRCLPAVDWLRGLRRRGSTRRGSIGFIRLSLRILVLALGGGNEMIELPIS